MISVITAVHNGLAFNQLFANSLKKFTASGYELIIIDNNSTDGSREYFEREGAKVIRNKENYSYPVCQNQGIEIAKGTHLFFLNNDIILSPLWDAHLIEIAAKHSIDIISACGIENMGDLKNTLRMGRKWKRCKNILMPLGFSKRNLMLMHRLMYGNWIEFCNNRFKEFGDTIVEGIVGNNVMMTRKGLNTIGLWDTRMQSADFDLFMRTKQRHLETGDIKPCHIALGVYIHHFIRMTAKYAVKPVAFADKSNLIHLHDKWSQQQLNDLHPDNATLRKL